MWMKTAAFGTSERMRASISSESWCARCDAPRVGDEEVEGDEAPRAGLAGAEGVELHAVAVRVFGEELGHLVLVLGRRWRRRGGRATERRTRPTPVQTMCIATASATSGSRRSQPVT